MSTTADTELVALDRFVSTIYWADDDLTVGDALPDAIADWTACAAAEHNESRPFADVPDSGDQLADALRELLAAVESLNSTQRRPGLTVTRAMSEALADWTSTL